MSRTSVHVGLAGALLGLVALTGCSTGSDVGGPVCAAYLRYNDTIAEAHDVKDLRAATQQLRDALPDASSDPRTAAAARSLDDALHGASQDPTTYLQAASGVAGICDFAKH